MNMMQIRQKAQKLGINPGRMKKPELIQAIQKTEGNTPCFVPGPKDCNQDQCCWRLDCVTDKKQ